MRTIIVALLAAVALAVTGCAIPEEPTAVQPAEAEDAKGASGSSKPAKKVTVKLVAEHAKAKRSILSAGQPLSCVHVTVTNRRKNSNLAVNPLYFSLVDSTGEKHETSDALGEYEGQIDTTTLAPGEKAKGLVCARGRFTPRIVAMTNEVLSEQARAEVA